jgi:hypothetical protein
MSGATARILRLKEEPIAGWPRLLGMAALVVDGADVTLVHRSVLDRTAEIAGRLGCRSAVALGSLPASFNGAALRPLRRDLDQIAAFADAALRTGWVLGDLAMAPGDQPDPVLEAPEGRLRVDPVRGFELCGSHGPQRVISLAQMPGMARRTTLARLVAPLVDAVARAHVLEAFDEGRISGS